MKRAYWLCLVLLGLGVTAVAEGGGQLRFCLRSEPKTFNPLMVNDDASETIRYLTGGVLVRVNRITQAPQPELAEGWKLARDGKRIVFKLRSGIRYSDGTPFSAADVVYTIQQLMDPALHTPTGDAFRSAEGSVTARAVTPTEVEITFPAPVANLVNLFDTVAIVSAQSPHKEAAALGPFYLAEHKAGAYILLKRNPYYWKKDAAGRALPYLDSVRLDIEQNRDIEAMRYSRGEIQLINDVSPALFEKLSQANPALVRDAGPSTDTEELWFNQVASAPIPAYKRAWFRSTVFRRALSAAIDREDLARVVFRGHAVPALGIVPPSNRFWVNASLKPRSHDPSGALRSLAQEGFHLDHGTLRDSAENPVEFSIITNAGNRAREDMAAMIQQDWKSIGIKVNVVTLDFSSLLERITQTYNYEASLLGTVNGDLDPSSQMAIWLSSGEDHIWNPREKAPASPWEAEIDKLMRAQASTADQRRRKAYWDRVQEIAWEHEPILYLVHKDALVAVSPEVKNAEPTAFRPQTYWNIEQLALSH